MNIKIHLSEPISSHFCHFPVSFLSDHLMSSVLQLQAGREIDGLATSPAGASLQAGTSKVLVERDTTDVALSKFLCQETSGLDSEDLDLDRVWTISTPCLGLSQES